MGRRYQKDERYIITICHGCKKTIRTLYLVDDTILEARCPGCGKVWTFEAEIDSGSKG